MKPHRVTRYRSLLSEPPQKIPCTTATDAPLLGNGDLGVCIGGPPEHQGYWIAKNDFWKMRSRHDSTGVRMFGTLRVSVPRLQGSSYHVEQELQSAVTLSRFSTGSATLHARSWVAATANVLVVELEAQDVPMRVVVSLEPGTSADSKSASGRNGEISWARRGFDQGVDMSVDAVCALKVVGANASAFDLQPGRTVRLVLAMATSFEASDCLRSATELVVMHADQLDRLWREHAAWWDRYWNQSEVGIGDPVIEQRYYLSNYVMASASRNLDFPPSIFGTWVTTDDPAWFGDYHLNYNHQAPYYGLYSSNHIEQADPADSPCIAFMDRGQWYARSLQGCRGVYYPVGIGPKGIETTRVNPPRFPWHSAFAWQTDGQGLFHGQKSNTSFISSQQARSSRGSNDWTPPSGVRTCPAPAVAPAPLPAVPVIASAPAVSLAAEPV